MPDRLPPRQLGRGPVQEPGKLRQGHGQFSATFQYNPERVFLEGHVHRHLEDECLHRSDLAPDPALEQRLIAKTGGFV